MKTNTYAGPCSCGQHVPAKRGVIARGRLYCSPCYTRLQVVTVPVVPRPKPRTRKHIYFGPHPGKK